MAKRLRSISWLLASVLALLALAAWWLLRGSLPTLDGRLELPGLSAAVEVARDRMASSPSTPPTSATLRVPWALSMRKSVTSKWI